MATYLDGMDGGKHNSDNTETSFTPHFKLLYQQLIERVVEQISEDLHNKDVEALEELLKLCNTKFLIAYLPEVEHHAYEKLTRLKSNDKS